MAQAFLTIQQASRLTFTPALGGVSADIRIQLGGRDLDPDFGVAGGVLGNALPPIWGDVRFDNAETWLPMALAGESGTLLLPVALHEICHALGIGHSDNPASIMYPYAQPEMGSLDAETIEWLRQVYDWSDTRRAGRTGDRPSLVSVPWRTLTDAGENLTMFYRGIGDDSQIWEQTFNELNIWSAPVVSGGLHSSQSPSVASRGPREAGPGATFLSCKGPGENKNPHIATRDGTLDWNVDRLDDSGTTERPAVAWFDGALWMVWRGATDDRTLWWSEKRDGGWIAQKQFRDSASTHSPALVVFRERLWVFWKGAENDSTIWFTSRGEGASFWEAQQQLRWEHITTKGAVWQYPGTSSAPAATLRPDADGGRLFLVWKGAGDDTRIWFTVFDGEQFNGQMPIADFVTAASPDIEFHNGRLFLAWRGPVGNWIAWATL